MQGGIHPDLPGTFYFDLLDAVKAAAPEIHVHAFSPMEILNGATQLGVSFEEFLTEAKAHGLGTIPGTAAEILDDDVRWLLTKGKLPADTWEEIVRTAHGLGHPFSSSTIMFGHVDAPPHWVAHLRRLARIQADTGGFTEFVPLPVRASQRADLSRRRARVPDRRSTTRLRMHAVARILLDGAIHNIQVSWVKLGVHACQSILRGRCERFRRHADGGDDQSHGGCGMGHRDDTCAFRRRDPCDRSRPCRPNDDVRTHRAREIERPYRSICLTVSVNRAEPSNLCPKALATRPNARFHDVRYEGEAEDSFEGPLVIGAVLPSESHGCDFGGR